MQIEAVGLTPTNFPYKNNVYTFWYAITGLILLFFRQLKWLKPLWTESAIGWKDEWNSYFLLQLARYTPQLVGDWVHGDLYTKLTWVHGAGWPMSKLIYTYSYHWACLHWTSVIELAFTELNEVSKYRRDKMPKAHLIKTFVEAESEMH